MIVKMGAMPNIKHLVDNLVASLTGRSNISPVTYGDSIAEQVNGYLDRHPNDADAIAREFANRLRDAALSHNALRES